MAGAEWKPAARTVIEQRVGIRMGSLLGRVLGGERLRVGGCWECRTDGGRAPVCACWVGLWRGGMGP